MKRTFGLLMLALAAFWMAGCEDNVKTVKQSEQTHESEPEMVSPGEMIVE